MTFGTTVLGSGMAMVTGADSIQRLICMFAGGFCGTIALAYIAFRIKNDNYETGGFCNRNDHDFWYYCISCDSH